MSVALRRIVVGALHTNCWAVHAAGARAALLVDPGADPGRVLAAVADLDVTAIVLTHAHFDHVLAVDAVRTALGAPVFGHPAERTVWAGERAHLRRTGHFDAGTDTAVLRGAGVPLGAEPGVPLWSGRLDHPVGEGAVLRAGPLTARVLHTPGHTPGGLTLAVPGHLLTGDTLFPGGPGLTGPPLSDFGAVLGSVRRLLHGFAPDTVVHPGHGANTTVGAERPALADWAARGW